MSKVTKISKHANTVREISTTSVNCENCISLIFRASSCKEIGRVRAVTIHYTGMVEKWVRGKRELGTGNFKLLY